MNNLVSQIANNVKKACELIDKDYGINDFSFQDFDGDYTIYKKGDKSCKCITLAINIYTNEEELIEDNDNGMEDKL